MSGLTPGPTFPRRAALAAGAQAAAAAAMPFATAASQPAVRISESQAATLRQALRSAVRFFRDQVSVEGGYLWRYSADLARREGEGRASATTAWVQPPGTPSVGLALLQAHQLTGEPLLLEAARQTATALAKGQLLSGGWDYRIEFAPEQRQKVAYRLGGNPQGRNTSTLDDNTTQAALTFLIAFDHATGFSDATVRQTVAFALRQLIKVQFPNGGWPQRFDGPVDPADYPIVAANYPASWSRSYVKRDYRNYYTFNDNAIADVIDVMFLAAQVYNRRDCGEAAERAGDFILLAQMPEPQPAWAQQYNAAMQPAWARKFEPPAVTGGESQGILRTLMRLYERTGKAKYLKPVPAALEYLEKSRLPDGRLARFYELKTNRPLYFDRQYQLTYQDDDLPTHYGFQVGSHLEALREQYARVQQLKVPQPAAVPAARPGRLTAKLLRDALAAASALDTRGAWVEDGRLRTYDDDDPTRRVIETRTFISNLELLARCLAAAKRP